MTPLEHSVRALQQTLRRSHAPSAIAEATAELAWQLRHARPKSSLAYARRAARLAGEQRTPAKANALLTLAFIAVKNPDAEKTGFTNILEAKAIAAECGDELLSARAMFMEGSYFSKYGDYRNGRELFLRALEIFGRLNARSDSASVRYNLGYQHGLLKEYPAAMSHMIESRTEFEQYGLRKQALMCSVAIVGFYMQTGDIEAATELCNAGMGEAEQLGETLLEARFRNLSGLLLAHSAKFDAAYEQFSRTAALALGAGDNSAYFMALINQTQILLQWGDYPKALANMTTVIGMAGNYHWDMRIHALNYAGKIFMALGDASRALEFFREAYSSVEKLETNHFGGIFLAVSVNLGMAYNRLGDYETAEYHMKNVAARASAAGDAIMSIVGYLGLATVFEKQKKLEETRSAAQQGKAIAANIGDVWGKITADVLIGQAAYDAGNIAQAAELFRNATATAESAGFMPLLADALQSLAHAEEKQGNLAEAFAALKRFYDIERSITGAEAQSAGAKMVVEFSTRNLRNEHSELLSKTELLELEVQRKERELQTAATQLAQKNEAVTAMRDELKAIAERRGRKSQKARRLLESSLGSHDPDGAWKQFDEQFGRVHGAFIAALNRQHTDLSHTEQKICCLLKIRLSSKEIANLLYLSTRTVETHRLNIRRKLGLNRALDIANYLNTIG